MGVLSQRQELALQKIIKTEVNAFLNERALIEVKFPGTGKKHTVGIDPSMSTWYQKCTALGMDHNNDGH